MDENTARYIVRMLNGFPDGSLFVDSTTGDAEEMDRMKQRYSEAGRWEKGAETAKSEFILRVVENGIPKGDYLSPDDGRIDLWLSQRGIPRIERN